VKRCTQCKETDRSQFSRRADSSDGLSPVCKACRKRYAHKYYVDNLQKVRATNNARYQLDKVSRTAKSREFNEKHPYRVMLQSSRRRAQQRGVPFGITEEDIKRAWPQDNKCPVLGYELKRATGQPAWSSPSLDAVVPAKGYVPGNICIISHRANCLKRDCCDPHELELLGLWMHRMGVS